VPIGIRHLRYFLSAAEHLQFGRAARALGVRQPTVSRQVCELEDRLGVLLFERHPRGIHLTAAGRTFAADAQRIMSELERATSRAARAGRAEIGVLRIAFYSSLAGGRLPELLGEHRQRWPKVELGLIEADPVQQLKLLAERRIDLAVVAAEQPAQHSDFETAWWWKEPVFVALRGDHELADGASLTWAELREETFLVRAYETGPVIYNWLAPRLAPSELMPNIQQQDVSREGLLGMVRAGFGVTIVSEPATKLGVPDVVFRPVADDNAFIGITAAWMRENANPALRRFLSFVREQLRERSPERQAGFEVPAGSALPG